MNGVSSAQTCWGEALASFRVKGPDQMWGLILRATSEPASCEDLYLSTIKYIYNSDCNISYENEDCNTDLYFNLENKASFWC